MLELHRSTKRIVDELSHDLRQPLSSMSMNLQSAIHCLRSPEPCVSSALEALVDCLDVEGELIALVTSVQHCLANELARSRWFSLNDLARDTYDILAAMQSGVPKRVAHRVANPAPYVAYDSWELRTGILAIARRLLASKSPNTAAGRPAFLVIETRWASGEAQLRLDSTRWRGPEEDLAAMMECAEDVARLSRGRASLDLEQNAVAIVLSFPAKMAPGRVALKRRSDGA